MVALHHQIAVLSGACEHGAAATWYLVPASQGRRYQRTFSGTSSYEDIVVSSTRAYVTALNKLIASIREQQVQVAFFSGVRLQTALQERGGCLLE